MATVAKFKADAKALKALRDSAEGQHLVQIGIAMFTHLLTDGLLGRWRKRQDTWTPLRPRYSKWKEKKGRAPQIWKNTGKTLRSIDHNVPVQIGTKKGLRYAINWRGALAFIFANTLKPKGAKGRARRATYVRLNFGHGTPVLIRQRSRKGKSFTYHRKEKGRELFGFEPEDVAPIKKHVEETMQEYLDKAGIGRNGV